MRWTQHGNCWLHVNTMPSSIVRVSNPSRTRRHVNCFGLRPNLKKKKGNEKQEKRKEKRAGFSSVNQCSSWVQEQVNLPLHSLYRQMVCVRYIDTHKQSTTTWNRNRTTIAMVHPSLQTSTTSATIRSQAFRTAHTTNFNGALSPGVG